MSSLFKYPGQTAPVKIGPVNVRVRPEKLAKEEHYISSLSCPLFSLDGEKWARWKGERERTPVAMEIEAERSRERKGRGDEDEEGEENEREREFTGERWRERGRLSSSRLSRDGRNFCREETRGEIRKERKFEDRGKTWGERENEGKRGRRPRKTEKERERGYGAAGGRRRQRERGRERERRERKK